MYFGNIKILNGMTSQNLEIKEVLETGDPECRNQLPGKIKLINKQNSSDFSIIDGLFLMPLRGRLQMALLFSSIPCDNI